MNMSLTSSHSHHLNSEGTCSRSRVTIAENICSDGFLGHSHLPQASLPRPGSHFTSDSSTFLACKAEASLTEHWHLVMFVGRGLGV